MAPGEQQLSLVPDETIQGSLFAPEPSEEEAQESERPKQRRSHPGRRRGPAQEDNEDNTSSDDEGLPRWHHHGLVDPLALTPMLRHYVELKAAHPERVLLYRLGDFFECFFEDALLTSRLLELTLTGKEGGKTIGRLPMACLLYTSPSPRD